MHVGTESGNIMMLANNVSEKGMCVFGCIGASWENVSSGLCEQIELCHIST